MFKIRELQQSKRRLCFITPSLIPTYLFCLYDTPGKTLGFCVVFKTIFKFLYTLIHYYVVDKYLIFIWIYTYFSVGTYYTLQIGNKYFTIIYFTILIIILKLFMFTIKVFLIKIYLWKYYYNHVLPTKLVIIYLYIYWHHIINIL